MFEFFQDIEIEWDKAGWAFALWAVCLLVLWKMMADPTYMKPHIRIILSIAILPINYFILVFMGNR